MWRPSYWTRGKRARDDETETRRTSPLNPTKLDDPASDACSVLDDASAEWRQLSRAIKESFETSSEISPDHPCAACLSKCNWRRLCQEIQGEGRWVDGCYTRTTLMQGDDFVVMLLCWPPGVSSPVHAHSDAETGIKSNCFMLVLDGALIETTFEPHLLLGTDAVAADEGTSRTLESGGQAYINDDMGVHKVGNGSSSQRAMSLHVYAPGWQTVQTYEEKYVKTPGAPDGPADAGGAPILLDGWGDF